jgi:hypothetical protein
MTARVFAKEFRFSLNIFICRSGHAGFTSLKKQEGEQQISHAF